MEGCQKPLRLKEVHFLQSSLRSPTLEGHAIGGKEYAGAIISQPTVNIDFLLRALLKQGEKLHKLVVLGRRPPAGANVYRAHAQRRGARALRSDRALSFTAKIHDDVIASFLSCSTPSAFGREPR